MRRLFGMAASFLFLLSLPVWAQHHGGGAHGISGGGQQSHPMRSFSNRGSGRNFGSVGTNFHITQGFGRRPGYPLRSGRRDSNYGRFHDRRFFYPYGAYYPYFGAYWNPYYPSDYDSSDYDNSYEGGDDSASASRERYEPPYRDDSNRDGSDRDDSNLERDVQSLNGKIDRLQADVEAQSHPKPLEPATALVFRDRHVLEVRNYAIAGGTLWVFTEQQSKKIPLAELDLNATAKMNDARGVDFQVPK